MVQTHVPIAPAEPYNPHDTVLYTYQGFELDKNSYVRTDRQISVKLQVLRPYRSYRARGQKACLKRLDELSLNKLRQCVRFVDHVGVDHFTTVGHQLPNPNRGGKTRLPGRVESQTLPIYAPRVPIAIRQASFGRRASETQSLLALGLQHQYARTNTGKTIAPTLPYALYGSGLLGVERGYGAVHGSRPQSHPSPTHRGYNRARSSDRRSVGPLAYIRDALLWALKSVPWRGVLMYLLLCIWMGGIGYGVYLLVNEVLKILYAVCAAMVDGWDQFSSFFIECWDSFKRLYPGW